VKVLYLAPDVVPAPKGAGVRIPQTLRALQRLGHSVELLTPAAPEAAEPLPQVAHERVELGTGPYLERMLAFRAAARRWLGDRRADWVQVRGVWAGLAALRWAQAEGVPLVYEAHGLPSVELPQHYPRLWAAPDLLDRLVVQEAELLAGARRLITHSRTGARFLLMRGVGPERVRIVPNCADPALFAPPPGPPPGPPADSGALRVLYQGTLTPWQGLGQLVEALGMLRRSGPFVLLLVAGPRKARWRRPLLRLARRLRVHEQIAWLGPLPRPALADLVRTSHVCAVPLPADARNVLQGCSPIKVFEAMAAARPILGTAVPPLLELLVHEQTARLVRPSSAAALADGLRWMAAHPAAREELGAAARQVLLARHTPEQFVARWEQALAGVVQ